MHLWSGGVDSVRCGGAWTGVSRNRWRVATRTSIRSATRRCDGLPFHAESWSAKTSADYLQCSSGRGSRNQYATLPDAESQIGRFIDDEYNQKRLRLQDARRLMLSEHLRECKSLFGLLSMRGELVWSNIDSALFDKQL